MTNWELFSSTFILIFLAELPDKTAVAVLLMASRGNPKAVFGGVSLAFAFQSAVAVTFGSLLGLLPHHVVEAAGALLFFVFAVMMWLKKSEESEEVESATPSQTSFQIFRNAFIVIFIAEWGDLTQLATATLQARNHKPALIFAASTLALWSTTAVFVFVGHHARKLIKPDVLQKVAAIAFFIVGLWMSYQALVSAGFLSGIKM